MMSAVLGDLRKIAHPGLAEERQREFRELIAGSPPLSDEALAVTADFAHLLYWYDMDPPRPNTGRPAGPDAPVERDPGPPAAGQRGLAGPLNGVLGEYLSQLRDSRQYSTAEDLLEKSSSRSPKSSGPPSSPSGGRPGFTPWSTTAGFRSERGRRSLTALTNGRSTGSGPRPTTSGTRGSSRPASCSTAAQKGLPNARPTLSRFAFDTLPGLLTRSMHNYDSAISQVSSTVRQHLDRREDLRFLLRSLQKYPAWLQYSHSDGWNYHGSQMASSAARLADIGDLEGPLLELVLTHLRRGTPHAGRRENQSFTRANYGYFWSEKQADFPPSRGRGPRRREELPANHRVCRGVPVLRPEEDVAGDRGPIERASPCGLLDDRGINSLVHYLDGGTPPRRSTTPRCWRSGRPRAGRPQPPDRPPDLLPRIEAARSR